MQKRLLGIIGLGAILLLSGCDRAPSNQVSEQVWREEIIGPHMEELVELLGLQARSLIVNDFEVKDIVRLGNGVYGVNYQSTQQLTRPLSELSSYTPPSVMRIIRSIFPTGEAGETSSVAGFMKLKKTDSGWQLIDREITF
jgi:hypothetical protein